MMKDYRYHKKVIDDVIAKLNELDIDMYLIITAEGCDQITSFIPGVDTVGSGAFMFTRDGRRLATASSIDAQDSEESGLFDEVIRYETYYETLAEMVRAQAPKKIALNYSEKVPFCDGLTMGKYQKFIQALGDYSVEVCSSDLFIPAVQEMNKR